MTQKISDLVINLDVDSARFAEQITKIKDQLKGITDDSEKSQSRTGKAIKRQIAALQQMGVAGVHAVRDIQEKQSAAADAIENDWKKIARAVEDTHQRVAEFNQQLKKSSELVAALGNQLQETGVTLANQAGWTDKLMTLRGLGMAGVVVGITAAVYGLGKAWYEGSQVFVEFNKQLILTGSYAGKTAEQLAELAKSISGRNGFQATTAAVLAKVVGSGSFDDSQIEGVTRAAVAMQEATGKSVDETIRNFQKLYDSPTKASAELNTQLHYLTAAQFEYISSLERRGDKEGAGQAAADAFSRSEQQRSQQILDNLGLVERAALITRNAFKGMWDELLNIGQPAALQDMLAQAQQRLSSLEKKLLPERQRMVYGYSYDTNAQNQEYDARRRSQLAEINSLKTRVISLQQTETLKNDLNAALLAGSEINNNAVDAQMVMNRYLDAGTTAVEKRTRAYDELDKAIAANTKAAQAGIALLWSQEDIAKARAGIDKQYNDSKIPKAKRYITSANDRDEDAGRQDLLVLQSQLNVLQKHKSAIDGISQQRKELRLAEEQFSVLEEAARTNSLSKQEQSLLASKQQVLQLADKKAMLGDQIVAEEQLNKRVEVASKYVTQMTEKQSALEGSSILSDRLAGRASTFAQLRSLWIDSGGSLQDEGYQQQLKAVQDYYAYEDNLRNNWQAGLQKSWANYADNATNIYEQMKSAGASAFNGLSSQLTSFVTTGKSSFQDFSVSILGMITDILLKMALVNGAKGIAGALGWGGLIANANGGVYNSASLSAYSGSVVDRPTFFAFAKGGGIMGESGPEAILPLRRGSNGKLGVVAGSAGIGSPVFNNTIIMQNDGTASATSSGSSHGMSKAMMKMLDQFCQNNIARAIRPGGQLFNAMKSR